MSWMWWKDPLPEREPLPERGKHPPIPDWRKFKVEECPELLNVQKELAAYGLKDPWLRNEVWRYDVKTFGTKRRNLATFYLRGFKWGLILALTHAGIKMLVSKDDHHEEHH